MILLVMADVVSVSYPPVSLIPRYVRKRLVPKSGGSNSSLHFVEHAVSPPSSLWKFYLFALAFSRILSFLVEFLELCLGEKSFFAHILAKIARLSRISSHSSKEKQGILPFL